VVANTILGGQFVSRIQPEPARGQGLHLRRPDGIRVSPARRAVSAAGQRADRGTARAIEESIGEMPASAARARSTGEELALAVAGSRAGTPGTSRRRSRLRAPSCSSCCSICPTITSRRSFPAIARVTAEDVSHVMARHIDPARLTTLIVGISLTNVIAHPAAGCRGARAARKSPRPKVELVCFVILPGADPVFDIAANACVVLSAEN